MLRSSCLAWMLPMKHICYLSYNRSGCSSWLSFITVVIQAHASSAGCQSRFSFSFLPKRGQNEIVWVIGGRQVCIHVQSMWQTKGVRPGGMPREMEPFNRCNLVESGTAGIHTTTIYIPDCLLNTVLIPCLLVFFLSIRRMSAHSRAPIQAYSAR